MPAKEIRHLITMLLTVIICQIARASYPVVVNFPRQTTGGGTQTWAICRNNYGEMYFGNKNGLLIYDSHTWRLAGVENGSTVRSLLIGDNPGELFVGASEEFGVFRPDPVTGKRVYTNLSDLIPETQRHFKEIWNILKLASGPDVWFQSDNHIFHYDGKKVTVIPSADRITASAAINNNIYIATAHGHVAELHGDDLHPILDSETLRRDRISAILPYNNTLMLVTDFHGLYIVRNNGAERLATDIDDFLTNNQAFCAACSDDGHLYAFGTVARGVVIKNFMSGATTYANAATGMQNNTVLTAYFDPDNNLWLGLDNGIDMVNVNSPYYSLLGDASRYGAGYMSLQSGNKMYLGTNQGLFALDYPDRATPEPPSLNPIARGQVWDITAVDNEVFVCTDAGVLHGHGESFQPVTAPDRSRYDMPGAWASASLIKHPGYMLVSGYDSFYLLHREGDRWVCLGPVDGYNDIGGHFVEDSEGDIWISHWLKGVYRLTLDPVQQRFTDVRFYDSTSGLPTNRNVGVAMIDDEPLFTSEGGFYRLAPGARTMQPDTILNSIFGAVIAPRIHCSPNGNLWCIHSGSIEVATRNPAGAIDIDSLSFTPLADRLIPGFDNFNFLSDNRLIISTQDGFYDVDCSRHAELSPTPGVWIRSLKVQGDTTISYDPRYVSGTIDIPYSLNSLLFEAMAPEYRDNRQVMYSYYLENYDHDWSPWSDSPTKEYTQLHEGEYKMHVRALNPYTHAIDERVLQLSVLPPWFRSTPAKIVYAILVLCMIGLGWRAFKYFSSRASVRVADRKEKEMDSMRRRAKEESLLKDYEIAELKGRQLEQDIKHKTEELSNITMNVVRKNEILLDISNRLDRLVQGDNSADIKRQVSRIQSLIRENISHDDDWRTFMHNFDAAYEDFTKKLQARHPGLTTTELRVCCYLKMGLSSKEIAPLFNISYRSVEMTRYRLRKKLGLTRDVSLTDYLQSIT